MNKKKIYYIIYSIVQMIISAVILFDLKSYSEAYLLSLTEAFSGYPEDIVASMTELFTIDMVKSMVMSSAIIVFLLAVAFLLIVLRDKVVSKKTLSIVLIVGMLLFSISDLGLFLVVATIVVIATSKKEEVNENGEKVVKEKKSIEKLRPLKVSGKDYLLTILLVVVYFSQFIIDLIPMSGIVAVVVVIAYYLITFGLVFYVFGKRLKRDFGALKKDFGTYAKYIFKMWAIMIGLSFVAAIIRIVFGADEISANQAGLNSMPLWYVVPLSIIWAPIVEEAVFRGSLRRFISNDKLFIVVSAILFGLLHTIGQEVGILNIILQSLQYVAMGGVMAYTYTKSNNICTNMGVHCIQNTLGSIMMILLSLV